MAKIKAIFVKIKESQTFNDLTDACIKTAEYLLTAQSVFKNYSFQNRNLDEKYWDILISQLNETKTFKVNNRDWFEYLYSPFLYEADGLCMISPPTQREVKICNQLFI